MTASLEVVSILESGSVHDETMNLWRIMENRYNFKNAQTSVLPYMTFLDGTCDDLDIEVVDRAFVELCPYLHPVEIIVDGMGWFESPFRTVYLRVIATDGLRQFHRQMYDVFASIMKRPNELYMPHNWVPHITLAVGDVTSQGLEDIKQDFSKYHPTYHEHLLGVQLIRMGMGRQIRQLNEYSLIHQYI